VETIAETAAEVKKKKPLPESDSCRGFGQEGSCFFVNAEGGVYSTSRIYPSSSRLYHPNLHFFFATFFWTFWAGSQEV